MKKRFLIFTLSLPFITLAQFAPAAGQPGSTAIKKDSSIIVSWATGCKVIRGYQDISTPSSGYTNVGDSASATGAADGVNVVSLGDGGTAILTFQSPVKNLSGADFCVFENSFDPGFLELAFVEVSSDGINFTRFPATSNMQNTVQIGPFDPASDPSKINNLAGKYIGGYGVPFDLQELSGIPGLDVNAITHVKIIDVVGCILPQYASKDKNNNIINDPWATAFGSGGFDLDAVGVIHQVPLAVKKNQDFDDLLHVSSVTLDQRVNVIYKGSGTLSFKMYDASGRLIKAGLLESSLSLEEYAGGVYYVTFTDSERQTTKKVINLR